eukprot:CAMPEP_0196666632 /NCGR_PEP_ID=MMETSP1086-20130531/64625_1 /TAXON_ID=77921 /ORGANISM="Cyanoptyche  gloeocystis , Strain SAG4.97" /LENGTH=318 /DNA_ID=CAMNT_0042003851 /DNA_START=255 /DNA_END=1212 /DNA_ORIENTATION=-
MRTVAECLQRFVTSRPGGARYDTIDRDDAKDRLGDDPIKTILVVDNIDASTSDEFETYKSKTLLQARKWLDDILRYQRGIESGGNYVIESVERLDLYLAFEVDMQRLSELIKTLKEREEMDCPSTSIRAELNALIKARSKLKELRNTNARKMLDFVRDETNLRHIVRYYKKMEDEKECIKSTGEFETNLRHIVRYYKKMEDEKECIKVYWGVQKLMKLDADKLWSSVVMYRHLISDPNYYFEIIDKSKEHVAFKHDKTDNRVHQVPEPLIDTTKMPSVKISDIEERYIFTDRKLEAIEILAGSESPLMKALGKSPFLS